MAKPKLLETKLNTESGNLTMELHPLEQRAVLEGLLQACANLPFQINVLVCELVKLDAFDAKSEVLLETLKKASKGNVNLILIHRILSTKPKLTDVTSTVVAEPELGEKHLSSHAGE